MASPSCFLADERTFSNGPQGGESFACWTLNSIFIFLLLSSYNILRSAASFISSLLSSAKPIECKYSRLSYALAAEGCVVTTMTFLNFNTLIWFSNATSPNRTVFSLVLLLKGELATVLRQCLTPHDMENFAVLFLKESDFLLHLSRHDRTFF